MTRCNDFCRHDLWQIRSTQMSGRNCLLGLLLPLFAPLAANAQVIGYYRFEEGSGTVIRNATDNSVAGTHNASYSTNVPVNPVPQNGLANIFSLQFNGAASAHVTAQPFILHSAFANATLEFWLDPQDQPH